VTTPGHGAGAFLGLPPEHSDRATARVLVLPIPYEATTSYVQGTAGGPAAILDASTQVELYDETSRDEPFRGGIHTLPALDTSGDPETVIRRIEKEVAGADGRFVLALGGEHSLTVGTVRGVLAQDHALTVVHVDAHADLRTEYEGERLSHACVMRRLVDEVAIVEVGIRSLSTEEADFIAERRIPIISAESIARARTGPDHAAPAWVETVVDAIATERVYLTIDLDGLDPSIMPAVGTPEPGGLLWYEILDLVSALFRRRQVVAADLVELSPVPGLVAPNFLAARLAYKIAGHALRA
jgi:agmatinase